MYVSRPRRTMSPSAPRQFSLRSLMVFVAVCAVYCSQFALIWMVRGDVTSWRGVATVGLAWLVLAFFYFRQKLFAVLSIHCLAPTTIATLLLCTDPLGGGRWRTAAVALVVVSFFANMACFPFAALIMAVQWCRRPVTHESSVKGG